MERNRGKALMYRKMEWRQGKSFLSSPPPPVADPGGAPYFFGNSAFSLECRNYLHRIQHS